MFSKVVDAPARVIGRHPGGGGECNVDQKALESAPLDSVGSVSDCLNSSPRLYTKT